MTLLRLIERHLRATGTPATRFGRQSVSDPRFVGDLRRGRQPRPATEARVRRYIDEYENGGGKTCVH